MGVKFSFDDGVDDPAPTRCGLVETTLDEFFKSTLYALEDPKEPLSPVEKSRLRFTAASAVLFLFTVLSHLGAGHPMEDFQHWRDRMKEEAQLLARALLAGGLNTDSTDTLGPAAAEAARRMVEEPMGRQTLAMVYHPETGYEVRELTARERALRERGAATMNINDPEKPTAVDTFGNGAPPVDQNPQVTPQKSLDGYFDSWLPPKRTTGKPN